jgi:sigma-E factor negative regulatory protein RseA
MNEELDSQLSAMFDDELPTAECELLARRLSRDEALKARWGRYAVVGAVIRAERGVRLNAAVAWRVNAAISAEPAFEPVAGAQLPRRAGLRWWQPVAGGALAASVAAASLLWLRAQAPVPLTAAVAVPAVNSAPAAPAGAITAASYVVPPAIAVRPMAVPSTELANYVVAHSMVSSPVARRNLLSSFVASEPATVNAEAPPAPRPQEDTRVHAQ